MSALVPCGTFRDEQIDGHRVVLECDLPEGHNGPHEDRTTDAGHVHGWGRVEAYNRPRTEKP